MRLQMNNRKFMTLLLLAAVGALFAAPVAAQEYQVTVNLFNDTSIPAPLSYTFDTTSPFASSNVSYTNLSVNFDSDCNGNCSVDSISYNNNESTISYTDSKGNVYGSTLFSGGSCLVWDSQGNCTINPLQTITTTGTYYEYGSGFTEVGDIVVSQVSQQSMPEAPSYFELGSVGLSLSLLAFARFSSKKRTER
jgi:hypothetical protein